MTLLFAAAMFVNALLLFLVQPMFAKLLLPLFGGSPAVWTTCMLFFQSALLAGTPTAIGWSSCGRHGSRPRCISW